MQTSEYPGRDLEALVCLDNYRDWIVDPLLAYVRGRLLELGPGRGDVTLRLLEHVDEAVLVEPTEQMAQGIRTRFAGYDHVRVLTQTLPDARRAEGGALLKPGSFDLAVGVNVLEHIEDDAGTLRDLCELLKPGGTLFMFVPAIPWLFGSLDRAVQHFRRYDKSTLRPLLEGAGFTVERLSWFDAMGVLPWLITGRVLRSTSFNEKAARLYDRAVVPWARRLERLREPPVGKNLWCVARKIAS